MALWSHAAGGNETVSVVTTVERFCRAAAEWNQDVHIYKVNYIDYDSPPDYAIFNYSDLLQFKHRAYTFESELRFIVPHATTDPSLERAGILMPEVDLLQLLERVEVHPLSSPLFEAAVRSVCATLLPSLSVVRSALATHPV